MFSSVNFTLSEMEEINIFSNWNFDDENKLKNLIIFSTPEKKECAMEHVTQESCVCLTKGENVNLDSKPELKIKSNNLIKEINILSEASLIEVFGVHDEYLFTCVSEFIDDWEGMAVYQANITLPGVSTCKLKFTRIKEKDRLWLYSIQLSITKLEEPSHLLFNFENVNNLINSPSQQISEKAEKFRKVFELYVKNSTTNQGLSLHNLLNVINRECNLEYSDHKQTMVDFLSSSNFFNKDLSLGKGSNRTNGNKVSMECQFLKDYIDNRLREMREDLISQMDIKLRELKNDNNTKLDHIIRLLEESKL